MTTTLPSETGYDGPRSGAILSQEVSMLTIREISRSALYSVGMFLVAGPCFLLMLLIVVVVVTKLIGWQDVSFF